MTHHHRTLRKDPIGRGRAPSQLCNIAPRGWICTRDGGHDGPCAAWPRWWMRVIIRVRDGWWTPSLRNYNK